MKKYIFPVLWMIVIFALSSIPGSELPKSPIPCIDKLAHLFLYTILGFLWARVLGKKAVLIISIGIIFGFLDEIHQIFVPYREFSLFDLLFDAIGVCLGMLCHLLLKRSQSGN